MRNSIKYLCAILMVLSVSVNAWGAGEYSVTINHTLTGCSQHAGNASSFMSNDNSTLSMYYDITSGYTGEGATLSLLTGSTSVASYCYSWSEYSTGIYKLDIYLSSIAIGNNQFYINISCPSTGGGGGGSSHTVSFSVGYGSAPSNQTGSSITLPAIPAVCSVAADARWQPYGWATASVADNSSSASIVGATGDTYNPDADRTLYAVYQKPGTELTETTDFNKISANSSTSNMPTSGYVILTQVALGSTSISNTMNGNFIGTIGAGEVTGVGNPVTKQQTDNANCIWEVSSPSSGVVTFKNVVSGKFLGVESSTKAALLSNGSSDYAKWTVASASDNGFYFTNIGLSGYYLGYSNGNGWRANSSTKNGTTDHIYVWKANTATTNGDKFQSSLTCTSVYHVYYDAGCDLAEITSGSVPVDNDTYAFGAPVDVAANTLVRPGYTFEGWLSSYNGNTYDGDGNDWFYMGDEDITLTAQWEEEECTSRTLSFANGTSAKTIYKADGTTYTNAATPSTGSGYGTVTYSVTSSTPSGCATVNGSGVVSFSNYGSATITASLGVNSTYCAAPDLSYTVRMECKSRTLTFASSTPSVSVTTDSYTQTATKSAGDGTISYSMFQSVGSGFTIDSETGEVSFNGNAGTATITASITADDEGGYCTAEESYTLTVTPIIPTVSNFSATSTESSMTLNGSAVTNNGGTTISDYGYIYSTTANAAGTLVVGGSGVTPAQVAAANITVGTAFAEKTISALSSGETYYVRAYATNSAGTGYSEIQTVKTVRYINYQFSCSELTLEGPTANLVFITSTASQTVRSQEAFHISGSGLTPGATVTFSFGNDGLNEVFSFKKADGTAPTVSNVEDATKGTVDADIYVFYTPAAGSTTDGIETATNLTATVAGAKPKTATLNTKTVIGRHLPADFVIACKRDNKWYAIPDTMTALRHPKPIEIAVDDIDNPSIAYTATSNFYKLYGQKSANDATGSGQLYTDNGVTVKLGMTNNATSNAPLFGSASPTTTVGKSGTATITNNIGVQYWWKLVQTNTTITSAADAKYKIYCANNVANENTRLRLRENAGNPDWGLFTSGIDELRLIPASDVPFTEAYFVEWGQHGGIIEVDAGPTGIDATSVVAHLGEATSSASLTNAGTAKKPGTTTKYNYIVDFGNTIDFAAAASNGALLNLEWKKDATTKAMTSLVVPKIIAADNSMYSIMTGDEVWRTEVHVLPGVTLDANAGSFAGGDVVIKQLEIYPGATVKVTTGTLSVTSLVLRNGWKRIGGTEYNTARLHIATAANLTKSNITDKWYSDWYIDYDQYYPVAVPWEVDLGENDGSLLKYKNTSSNAIIGKTSSVRLRYYDGDSRATNIQSGVGDGANWKYYGDDGSDAIPAKLVPGRGYAMTARRPTGKSFSIIRMPLTFTNAWGALGEQGSVEIDEVTYHKDQVAVKAYGVVPESKTPYAQGWNFIANPYMSLYQGAITLTPNKGDATTINVVNIPDVDFKEYGQYATLTTKLKPSSAFLIQTPDTGTITFGTTNRKVSAPSYRRETMDEAYPEQQAYIILSNENSEDMMGLFVSEKYTADYDLNGDVEKLLSDGMSLRTYMRYNKMVLAYVALSEALAQEWIPVTVRIPADGEYTFSMHEASIAGELEGVYLIDYGNADKVTNLIEENYSFTAEAGTTDNRFAINAIRGVRPLPTGVDVVSEGNETEPVKFIYHDKVYILYNDVIYDATGKKVREINK